MNTPRGFEGGEGTPRSSIFDELDESNEEDAQLIETYQGEGNRGTHPSEDELADENDELEALLSGRKREASVTQPLQAMIDEVPPAIVALEGRVVPKTLNDLLALRSVYYHARLAAGTHKTTEVERAYADYQAARQQLAREVVNRMEGEQTSPVDGRMLQEFLLSDQGLENTLRAQELPEPKRSFIGKLAAMLDGSPFGKALKFITMGVVAGTLATDAPKAPVEAPFRVETVASPDRIPPAPPAASMADAPVPPEVVVAHDDAPLLTDADITELTERPSVAPQQALKGEPFDNEGLWQPDSTREEGK